MNARRAERLAESGNEWTSVGPLAGEQLVATAEKPPRPHQIRQYARKRFAQELPALITTLTDAAIDGDLPSLKALIALSGYDRDHTETLQTKPRRGKSLAKLLLEDLEKRRADTKRDGEDIGGRQSNAV